MSYHSQVVKRSGGEEKQWKWLGSCASTFLTGAGSFWPTIRKYLPSFDLRDGLQMLIFFQINSLKYDMFMLNALGYLTLQLVLLEIPYYTSNTLQIIFMLCFNTFLNSCLIMATSICFNILNVGLAVMIFIIHQSNCVFTAMRTRRKQRT